MRAPARSASRAGWGGGSCVLSAVARPLLDAGEMIVVAFARRERDEGTRRVGKLLIAELLEERPEVLAMFVDELAKTHPILGLDPSRVTVVPDLHIGGGIDLMNADAAKRAGFEHRGLERQLRRKAHMHLLVARRGAGLVIEK